MSATQTHDPSARKLATAAQQGDFAKSQDLVSAALLAGMWLAVVSFGAAFGRACSTLMTHAFSLANVVGQSVWPALASPLRALLLAFAPLVLVPALFALIVSLVQSGFSFVPSTKRSAAPTVTRIAPERFGQAIITCLKLMLLAWVLVVPLSAALRGVLDSFQSDTSRIAGIARTLTVEILKRSAITLFSLGVVDFAYQRLRRMQRLRMTRREVDDERRQSEGDPALVAERRRRARLAAASQSSVEELSRVSLLVRGQGDRVVALRVDTSEHPAPRLWIKAQGELAMRIQQRASELGVVVHVDDELCAQLYRLETTQPIDAALYARVAQLMVFEGRA